MAKWVDISAHRVRVMTCAELANDFDLLDAKGNVGANPLGAVLLRRLSDGRAFHMSPWQPVDATMVALVEV